MSGFVGLWVCGFWLFFSKKFQILLKKFQIILFQFIWSLFGDCGHDLELVHVV
jgi:hypothetical protein